MTKYYLYREATIKEVFYQFCAIMGLAGIYFFASSFMSATDTIYLQIIFAIVSILSVYLSIYVISDLGKVLIRKYEEGE